MSHSQIPPSSAGIWAPDDGCPGWSVMSRQFPEIGDDAQASMEGTAAHELGAMMINSISVGRNGFPTEEKTLGTPAPNGVIYDTEIYQSALIYAEIVGEQMKRSLIFGGDNLGIEARVSAPSIHPELWGTVDNYMWDINNQVLHINDFKHGFGLVDVFENWQLIAYAAAIIETLGLLIEWDFTVSMGICQPRGFHRDGIYRTWEVKVSELLPFFKQLKKGAARAMGENPKTHSGPGHCKYCTARHACETARAAGMQQYEMTGDSIPVEMPTDELSVFYAICTRAKSQIDALCHGIGAQLRASAVSGERIPGYSLEPIYGRRAWAKRYDEVLTLGEFAGIDLRQKKLITPNQAESAGLSPALVEKFSEQNQSGNKLVADNLKNIRKVFSQ